MAVQKRAFSGFPLRRLTKFGAKLGRVFPLLFCVDRPFKRALEKTEREIKRERERVERERERFSGEAKEE